MASNVNVYWGSFKATGGNVSVPQYSIDVQVNYIDANGQPQTKSGTVNFPNILAQLPPQSLADEMKDLMARYFRVVQGIDS